MATYSPSKITKDGNTYNFTDTTKIPLAGSNAISGSLIPSTDNAYNLGSFTYEYTYIYAHYSISNSDTYICRAKTGAYIELCSEDRPTYAGRFYIRAYDGTDTSSLIGTPSGTLSWNNKNVAMQEDTVPRSGGAVMGRAFSRAVNDSMLRFDGGKGLDKGASITLYGKDSVANTGVFAIVCHDGTNYKLMYMHPDGTWTWNGTACQITSDQRLKQQIAQIDDKLLTAWEDVNPVQFKYNDAVKEKSDNARLHTGYVVQQIDEACKSHNVDISKYGLYCHEEYEEETREVEHEDGTKTVEVVRPANEHYSLRYTEALIVECAYLRKCVKELRTEIEELKSSK